MTTQTITGVIPVATGSANDAWFRGLKNFSDALTALGIPKTADTGQVDWTTVTVPASGTYTPYEIRRLNDSYQSGDPLFMKIQYGRLTMNSNSTPVIQISLGTGSDGSGGLTGVIGTAQAFALATVTTSPAEWVMSSTGSGFAILCGFSGTSPITRQWLTLERLLGSDGEPLTGQFLLAKSNAASTSSYLNQTGEIQCFHFDVTHGYMETLVVPVAYVKGLSQITNSLFVLGSFKYPFAVLSVPTEAGRGFSKHFVGYGYADFLHNTEFDLTRFSDNETCHYRCYKTTTAAGAFGFMDTNSSLGNSCAGTYGMPAIYWA